jgi:hypothetical protein
MFRERASVLRYGNIIFLVTVRYKARVCGLLLAAIAGSNPTGGIDVTSEWCVMPGIAESLLMVMYFLNTKHLLFMTNLISVF